MYDIRLYFSNLAWSRTKSFIFKLNNIYYWVHFITISNFIYIDYDHCLYLMNHDVCLLTINSVLQVFVFMLQFIF